MGQHNGWRWLPLVAMATAVVAAPFDNLPPLSKAVQVQSEPREIDAGQTWTWPVTVPAAAADEAPILRLRARVQVPGGGGCNFVMQVLLDGRPVTDRPLRLRLLNKAPEFAPPGTSYRFNWSNPANGGWMTIFCDRYDRDWGGTGRDCEFAIDLSGLVSAGATVQLGLRHLMPDLPALIKQDRAPLVVDQLALGVLPRAEVARLREGHLAGRLRRTAAEPRLPADAKAAEAPYELAWSRRPETPPAQVSFDRLDGWAVTTAGDAEVGLRASVARRAWRQRTGELRYAGGQRDTTAELRPPQPVPIAGRFDAVDLWLYGALDRQKDRPVRVQAVFEDARGHEVLVSLGQITATYWGVQHGLLSPEQAGAAAWPLRFTGLVLSGLKVAGERRLYLESLACYAQQRRPPTTWQRPRPTVFPTHDGGLLPTAPESGAVRLTVAGGVATWQGRDAHGEFGYRLDPAQGCFHGLTAAAGAAVARPLDGGQLRYGVAGEAPAAAQVVSAAPAGDRFQVRWRGRAGGAPAEWTAEYRVSGRTLVADVSAPGGQATGYTAGQVTGLSDARRLPVPYLYLNWGGPAVAVGSGCFVSLLPDFYHSDYSQVICSNAPVKDSRVPLLHGVDYLPLSDGRRNGLRERLLVTISPEFADVLPNVPNPRSPNLERLAPYTFVMASEFTPQYWRLLKRHGLDYVIANDFARQFVNEFPEGFAGRWRPHPELTIAQVQRYRQELKAQGYLFGAYLDATDYFPLNEHWTPDWIGLDSQGNWLNAWYGNYQLKPTQMAELVRRVGRQMAEHYPPDCVYLDVHTNIRAAAHDYEAGVPGAGTARQAIVGNGDAIVEARRWYGSTMSEGICRFVYAGLCDMDYAQIHVEGKPGETPPLLEFDLLKVHPLQIGTMMGYAPNTFVEGAELNSLYGDAGGVATPPAFYRYVAASLAYGHSLLWGYGYHPPLARAMQYTALMQAPQSVYLPDQVTAVDYHDGTAFVPTSRALLTRVNEQRRVRVRYRGGLIVQVNYHGTGSWRTEAAGRTFELPPDGWVIELPGRLLAYSALVDGRRVDFVRCDAYQYLHSSGGPASEGAIAVEGAVWLKADGKAWQVLPCGDLGRWQRVAAEGYPARFRDFALGQMPADRGCRGLVIDTVALLNKPAGQVKVTGRDVAGQPAPVKAQVVDERHLRLEVSGTDARLE